MATLKIAYPGARDSFIRYREERLTGKAKVKARVSDRIAVRQAVERLKQDQRLAKGTGAEALQVEDVAVVDQSGYSMHRMLGPYRRATKGSMAPELDRLLRMFENV
jgi:hypothetical protein